jgi:hypothetical protein
MRRNPHVAALLSLLIPGMGHIYGGRGDKGAAVLASAIVLGNLNLLFFLLFITANPDPNSSWAYWIPRIGHDIVAIWSIAFWLWAVVDAWHLASRGDRRPMEGSGPV